MERQSYNDSDIYPISDASRAILYERERRLKGYPCLVKSLEMLCLNSIKYQYWFFLRFKERTGWNPFDYLPNSLKIKLLGNTHWTWREWEQLLFVRHASTLKIHLDTERDAGGVINFCSSLAKEQPQLEEFSWHGRGPMFESFEAQDPIVSLPIFANLESLELYIFKCNDHHLQMIATHLTKLRYLKLTLEDDVTAEGICALSTLQHLQRFPYSTGSSRTRAMLYNLCLQRMPKLLEIADIELNIHTIDGFTDLGGDDLHIYFQSLQTPVELGLQQMVLHLDISVIPRGISFPNLTTLCLIAAFVDDIQQLDSRFSKVTELIIVETSMQEIQGILNIFGDQIRKLAILEEDAFLELDWILELCPNLQVLCLGSTPRNLRCSTALQPDVDLKYLEELRVDFSYVGDRDFYTPGVLVQLLMAPNLCKIDFECVDFKDDADAIVRLVQQGQILQKLEIFEYKNSIDNDELLIRAQFHLVRENIIKYCPQFLHFYLSE